MLMILALALAAPAAAQSDCRLCYSDSGKPGERPLTLEIFADLNFAKLALTGRDAGPDMKALLPLIGEAEARARLERAGTAGTSA